jgi:hypothetical protein
MIDMSVRGPRLVDATIEQRELHLQRRLAHWNRIRLAPSTPHEDWAADLDIDYEMRTLEGMFLERCRAEVRAQAGAAPVDADGFIAWFEGLKLNGPGQDDPLFPWLAEAASLDDMLWFLTQEFSGEAGFDDLLAMTQVKLPVRAKLEVARNYWDEMGRGSQKGMHGPMLSRLAQTLELNPTIETTGAAPLSLGNAMVAMATSRRYAYQSLGALGVIELTAPWRAGHVAAGLKRLGLGKERQYYALHSVIDVEHSCSWNKEVLRPLVQEHPASARHIAEGALIRLTWGQRCFDEYRSHLWSDAILNVA